MKNKFIIFVLQLFIFFTIVFVSCKNGADTENTAETISSLKFLTITNAKNLYISSSETPNRSARDVSSSTQKIFKINENGYTEEVKYLDENGNEIIFNNTPTFLQVINSVYTVVGFDGFPQWPNSLYLVRNNDGAVYIISDGTENTLYEQVDTFINAKNVQIDKYDNIYYRTVDGKIIKLSNTNSSDISKNIVSPSTDLVRNFEVDSYGNIAYYANRVSDTNNYISRIRKTNGELFNLSGNGFWVGLNQQDFFCYGTVDNKTGLLKISINPESFEVTTNYYCDNNIIGSGGYKIELKNKLYWIGTEIYEVQNSSSTPRKINLDGINIKTTNTVVSTENYYYIAGIDENDNSFLIKVNPENDTYINLLTKNEFDVYSFTASETDGIVFNALRMSDGKKIIGKVSIIGGQVTIIDEESDSEISYLQRIN